MQMSFCVVVTKVVQVGLSIQLKHNTHRGIQHCQHKLFLSLNVSRFVSEQCFVCFRCF